MIVFVKSYIVYVEQSDKMGSCCSITIEDGIIDKMVTYTTIFFIDYSKNLSCYWWFCLSIMSLFTFSTNFCRILANLSNFLDKN